MIFALLFLAAMIALIVVGIRSAKKQKEWLLAQGVPEKVIRTYFDYEGGHPELASSGSVRVWSTKGAVSIAHYVAKKVVQIPMDDIVTLTLDNNIQNVSVGGARSIGGALVGAAVAGPVGAMVGGRSSAKVKQVDESKTYLIVNYGRIQVKIIFKGGVSTYNRMSTLFAKAI